MQIVRPEAAACPLLQNQTLLHYLNPTEHPLPEGPQWVAIDPALCVARAAVLAGEAAPWKAACGSPRTELPTTSALR